MDEGRNVRADDGRAINVMAISVTVFVAGVCLYVGRFVLVPLVIALFLCKITQPLVEFLRARRVPWWISVTGLMVLMSGFIVWGALVLAGRSFVFIESQRASSPRRHWTTGATRPRRTPALRPPAVKQIGSRRKTGYPAPSGHRKEYSPPVASCVG